MTGSLDLASLPLFLKPKLRLFLSVDIVNSTSFKQAAGHSPQKAESKANEHPPAEPWFSPISRFYREIEKNFSKEWQQFERLTEIIKWNLGSYPKLWKAAGDELLYVKELTDHRQALVCVRAWMNAVNTHRKDLKMLYPMLDLKTTAWLAGFPVSNAEIILLSTIKGETPEYDIGDPVFANLKLLEACFEGTLESSFIDYIGPSIDTGFRVASLATPRKMAITVDLALILAHATVNQPMESNDLLPKFKFHYDGRVTLKGVFDGSPYPFFWLDMIDDDELHRVEDALTKSESIGSSEVKEFSELFISKSGKNYIIKPFIIDNPDELFRSIPTYHGERLIKLAEYWKNENEKLKTEEASALEESEGTEEDSSEISSILETIESEFIQKSVIETTATTTSP